MKKKKNEHLHTPMQYDTTALQVLYTVQCVQCSVLFEILVSFLNTVIASVDCICMYVYVKYSYNFMKNILTGM